MAAASAPDLRRRALLRGRPSRAPIRPPWALAEAAFLSRCTRCLACVERCPEQILVRADGGFPELRPGRGECTFCGDCVAACEPKALDRGEQAAPWSWRAAIGPSCLGARGIVCQSCREVCPTAAIHFRSGAVAALPVLDADACSGCGACLASCPVGAIDLTDSRITP